MSDEIHRVVMPNGTLQITYTSYLKGNTMNASGTLRKLKDLDALEKRVKATVNPSQKMLQDIAAEREQLLKGDSNETLPGIKK